MIWDEAEALRQYDEGGWSIWGELKEVVGLWTGTFREYWGVDGAKRPEGITEMQQLERSGMNHFALAMLKMIRSVNITGAAPEGAVDAELSMDDFKSLRSYLRKQSTSPLVEDRIGLTLAAEFVDQIDGAGQRAVRLLGIMMARPLSKHATSYVGRAAHLYIEGLDVETAVLCRAALEAALADRLEECMNQDDCPLSLDEMIRLAGQRAVLTGFQVAKNRKGWGGQMNSGVWRATRIQRAGNHVIHHALSYPPAAGELSNGFETIRELSLVVAELFPLGQR